MSKFVICATCRYRVKDVDCRPYQIRCGKDQRLRKENELRECGMHSVIS